MEYQGEDIDEFNTSEVDWGEEEFEPEVESHENESCCEKETCHYSWGREDAHEAEAWEEETDYEISYERGGELGDYERGPSKPLSFGYTNTSNFITHHRYSPRYSREMSHGYSYKRSMETLNTHNKKSHNYRVSPQQATYQFTQAVSTKQSTKGRDYSSNPLVFTGSSKDPEEYLKWETNMKQWLRSHNIPKEEKLDYALSMLKGEAYKWWLKEDAATYNTSKAVLDWGTLKSRMYREFTKKYQITTRSVKSTPNFQPSYQYKSTHSVQPKPKFIDTVTKRTKEDRSVQEEKIQQKLIIASLFEQQEPTKQVSRTKLFEEGENDEGSESAEKTPHHLSANTNPKIHLENSGDNFPIFLAHEESSSKWNHSNPSSHEEVMNFTIDASCNLSGFDQHALLEAPRSNQEDSNCKPTCSGILTQKGSFEAWNQTKPKSEEEDIQVTSQPDSDFAELDLPALIGDLRADEKVLGYKSNYLEILTHQGKSETWNHINPIFNEGVMDFTNQCNLHLPYLEAHEFGESQRCDWRPEDFLTQLEASKKTPRCILSHWIIGFQSHSILHQDLPYLDERDYNAIRRLLSFSRIDVHEFGSIYTLKRPSIHGYIILISRYKDQDPTVLKKNFQKKNKREFPIL